MSQIRLSAVRIIDAPADVVYHCIADYREHHRPGGFLPPVFSDLQVGRGGVGAGTLISFKMKLGGRTRTVIQTVAEPEPGRVLVESGGGAYTTFTVEPLHQWCQVRVDTLLDADGQSGLLTRLIAPRLLRPVYADELDRLEQHAQRHAWGDGSSNCGVVAESQFAPSTAAAGRGNGEPTLTVGGFPGGMNDAHQDEETSPTKCFPVV